MSMRITPLNITQSEDFDIVMKLIDQLSATLNENRDATNELLAVTDTLEVDLNLDEEDEEDTDTEDVCNCSLYAIKPYF